MLVLYACPIPPPIITDCRSILTMAAAGTVSATAPARPQAHIWGRIATALDGDVSVLITTDVLTWMPAHGSVATIGRAVRSDGQQVSALDWRANRLADSLAKGAVGDIPLCRAGIRQLTAAHGLVLHEAAVLGAVTHAANNHVVSVTGRDGRQHRCTLRDAAARRRDRVAAASRSPPVQQSSLPRCPVVVSLRQDAGLSQARPLQHVRRASAGRAAAQQRKAQAAAQLRQILLDGGTRRPSSAPPAGETWLRCVRAWWRGKCIRSPRIHENGGLRILTCCCWVRRLDTNAPAHLARLLRVRLLHECAFGVADRRGS